jgi:GNAT superfamily N-acetyltransferase
MGKALGDHEIVFKDRASSEDLKLLDDRINEHAESILGKSESGAIAYFAKAEDEIIGGVSGFWGTVGWLYVDQLWVSETHRGKGIGKHLMELIETEAVRCGCVNAYLYTMTFQAPDFYKRLGYTVFGELEDFPPGHSRLFLRKRLIP